MSRDVPTSAPSSAPTAPTTVGAAQEVVITDDPGDDQQVTVDRARVGLGPSPSRGDAGLGGAIGSAEERGGPGSAVRDDAGLWRSRLSTHPDGTTTDDDPVGDDPPPTGGERRPGRVARVTATAGVAVAGAVGLVAWVSGPAGEPVAGPIAASGVSASTPRSAPAAMPATARSSARSSAPSAAAPSGTAPAHASSTSSPTRSSPSSGAAGSSGSSSGAAAGVSGGVTGGCPSDRAGRYGPGGRGIGDVIDVRQWSLTLPTGTPGHPDRVSGPRLGTASGPGFRFDPGRGGIVFRVTAGGANAPGQSPRSELREMIGGAQAAWSATTGVHTFTVCQAVTRLPVGQPRVVTAQIHDAHHAVLQIRLEDTHLILVDGAGKKRSVLDPHYTLATPYRVTLVAAHGRIEVGYNGHHAGTIIESGSGWYVTTGAQLPAPAARGERAEATGEVVLYAATLRHDPHNLPEASR